GWKTFFGIHRKTSLAWMTGFRTLTRRPMLQSSRESERSVQSPFSSLRWIAARHRRAGGEYHPTTKNPLSPCACTTVRSRHNPWKRRRIDEGFSPRSLGTKKPRQAAAFSSLLDEARSAHLRGERLAEVGGRLDGRDAGFFQRLELGCSGALAAGDD